MVNSYKTEFFPFLTDFRTAAMAIEEIKKVNCNVTELSQRALRILHSLVYENRLSHNNTQCIDMKVKKEIGI